MKNKVSFVCTTYRRYTCIERIIEQCFQQDYDNFELIIYNTDKDHHMKLDFELGTRLTFPVKIVNEHLDSKTNQPYTNRGSILRDAVRWADGEYFMLADDDDVYLPWHIRQAVDGIKETGKDAWKPEKSFFASQSDVNLCKNTLEASVIVKMNRIREIGFREDMTGYEGLSWYTKLRDEGELDENNTNYVPSYCFNWSDPSEISGHKQSGDINNPDNFENHKKSSTDFSDKPLERFGHLEIQAFYEKYYDFLRKNPNLFAKEYYDKYARSYLFPE